eukprot:scaffold49326_cov29-Tisochrysis_lutea.AAC.9
MSFPLVTLHTKSRAPVVGVGASAAPSATNATGSSTRACHRPTMTTPPSILKYVVMMAVPEKESNITEMPVEIPPFATATPRAVSAATARSMGEPALSQNS